MNFAILLKALCRTPLVSASNFNSTFLTLIPRKTYIYVSPAILDISKPLHVPYRSYLVLHRIFSQTNSIFGVLMYKFSAPQQTSTLKLLEFFFKNFKAKWALQVLMKLRLQLKMLLTQIIFEWKVNQKTRRKPFFRYFCRFMSGSLTLRPRKMYVYVFRTLFGFCNFQVTSCFL